MQQLLAVPLGGILSLAISPPVVLAVGTSPTLAKSLAQASLICTSPPAAAPQATTATTRQLPQTLATVLHLASSPAFATPLAINATPVNASIAHPVPNQSIITNPPLAISAANPNAFAYPQMMRYPLLRQVPISSNFGLRIHPITGQPKTHAGVDFAADYGTPVVAALSGRVIYVGEHGGYGNVVAIQHSDDTYTLYAHLQDFYTEPGAWVEQGIVVATVGSTGFSTGPHLHFEVRQTQGGQWFAVDPGKYMDLRQL